jgi:hypothetical protein
VGCEVTVPNVCELISVFVCLFVCVCVCVCVPFQLSRHLTLSPSFRFLGNNEPIVETTCVCVCVCVRVLVCVCVCEIRQKDGL